LEEVKFYILNRRYNEAEHLLKEALKDKPYDDELLYNLAIVYELRAEPKKAMEIYRKIVQFSPEGRRVAEAKRRLQKLEGGF